MKIIVCLDNKDGMMFNNRRQSRDSSVYDDIIRYIGDSKLYVNKYSSELFEKYKDKLIVCDELLINTTESNYCFVENVDDFPNNIDELIIYRWDKIYPGDKKLNIEYTSMKLKNTLEFRGSSHDKVIREVYINEKI